MRIKELKRIVDKRDITFDYKASAGSVLSVESSSISLEKKEIVEAQTISDSNITLSGNQTINGFTTVNGTSVLVNGQTDPKDNGIYYANSSTWSRIPNDLNDIKLVKVVGGDYNTQFYTLQNEPIEIDTDNINYVKVYEDGAIPILSTSFSFDELDMVGAKTTFLEIIPGIANYAIDIISVYLKVGLGAAITSGSSGLLYQNSNNNTYDLASAYFNGTGTVLSKIFTSAFAYGSDFQSGDSVGIYNPSFIYTSGNIDATIYITYRYLPL